MFVAVSPLSHVELVAGRRRPSHVISIVDPGVKPKTPKGVAKDHHLRINAHDISETADGKVAPDEELVGRILAFGAQWNGTTPLLIHCHAGISRSVAAAFALVCQRNPRADEQQIAQEFRRQSRHAQPNRRIVALADDLLGRDGRMVAAVEAIGRGAAAMEGAPFEVRAHW